MKDQAEIKAVVKEKYAQIAEQSMTGGCCCGGGSCCAPDYTAFSEDYSKLAGYAPGADLKLGCGIPTETARIKPGDVVVDLGSGAGNDAFVARALVGESGKVIGVDMTEAMIEKARINARTLKFNNVEFRLGEIEQLPVADDSADVVLSNCVLNLVPDKARAFSEIFRILKPGAHFSISDVVLSREIPSSAKTAAELYAGCVAGAMLRKDYLTVIENAGFKGINVTSEKPLPVPPELLANFVSADELRQLEGSGALALSITVYAEKPV